MYRFTRREWMALAGAGLARGESDDYPRVEIEGRAYRASGPRTQFEWGSIEYTRKGFERRIVLDAPPNARLIVPHGVRGERTWLPLRTGVLAQGSQAAYELAGGHTVAEPQRLAMPLVDIESGGRHYACCGDPAHTTGFLTGEFEWVHTAGGRVERNFYVVPHDGDFRSAVDCFYRTALASVKPGPDWLHEVAVVDYDYLSKNGRGWFADIDRLAEVIPRNERHRVVMTLHGWYDLVGRYSYNSRARSLEKKWTAFPNVDSPGFKQHAIESNKKNKLSGWRHTFGNMRPVEMTIKDVHRRIRYAKDKGFRCVLYFADGMNSGDGIPDVHDPTKVLSWGGWIGPETAGKTYVQNPLHPAVRAYYKGYLEALLDEYGKQIDGLVWDETFTVKAGQMGPRPYTGYADAAMMSLVSELRARVETFSSHLAFMSSDDLSANYRTPYALVAHGTYQDSACAPSFWPYGLFPNFRNVLWSCNWYPETNWHYNERAVDPFGAPVAISNGYGDDFGAAQMNQAQIDRTLALYRKRAARRTRIGWIEEAGGRFTYQGVEIPRP